jgi:cleavage stimulation factor subunit 2
MIGIDRGFMDSHHTNIFQTYHVGGRPMRIDFADVDPMFEGRTTQMGQVDSVERGARTGPPPALRGGRAGLPGVQQPERLLPPNLPKGQALPPGVGATDSISQTLAALPPNQLLDIMSQMKSLVTSSPDQARTLLNGHPQLAYALFQAMLMMNVVDATILQRILTTSGALGPESNGAAPPVAPGPPPPQQNYSGGPPPMGRPGPPYGAPPPISQPPMAPPQQQQQQDMSHLPEEQRILLKQVLELTPDQIAALPADQQEGIRQLKASLGQA